MREEKKKRKSLISPNQLHIAAKHEFLNTLSLKYMCECYY